MTHLIEISTARKEIIKKEYVDCLKRYYEAKKVLENFSTENDVIRTGDYFSGADLAAIIECHLLLARMEAAKKYAEQSRRNYIECL